MTDNYIREVLKEFDEAFKDMATIWPKAYDEDAKKHGFPTKFENFPDVPIGKNLIKQFIQDSIEKDRARVIKALEDKLLNNEANRTPDGPVFRNGIRTAITIVGGEGK